MTVDDSTSPRLRFAERLRNVRKARGYRTAKSLALRLAIDQNTYTRYERGEVEPSIAMIERIWLALDLPGCDLFGPEPPRGPGFADGVDLPLAAPSVPRRDLLAWRVAEAYVQAVQYLPTKATSRYALQQQGRLFGNLLANPLTTLAQLTQDTALDRIPPDALAALRTAIDRLASDLEAGVEPPPRKPLRRGKATK